MQRFLEFIPLRLFAMAVAIVLVFPVVCRAQAQTPIVVAAIRAIDCTPFYYALQQGLFDKAGLKVTLALAPSGAASITSVVGSSADIGFANTLSLVTAHARGIPIVLVAAGEYYQPKSPNVAMLVPKDGPVQSLKDLDGRSIGVTGLHDLLTFSTMTMLERAGLNPANVKFVEISPTLMATALQAKRVDAVSTFDPFVEAVENAGGRVIGRPSDTIAGGNYLPTGWFAQRSWAESNRDALARFVRVIRQAADYTNHNYDAMIPTIATYTGFTPETLRIVARPLMALSLSANQVQPVIDLAAKYKEFVRFDARDVIF